MHVAWLRGGRAARQAHLMFSMFLCGIRGGLHWLVTLFCMVIWISILSLLSAINRMNRVLLIANVFCSR